MWEKHLPSHALVWPSQEKAVCRCCYSSLSTACFCHPEEHYSPSKTLVSDPVLMPTTYSLLLTKSSPNQALTLRGFPAKTDTFSSHVFIHLMGTVRASIPLNCAFTPSQPRVAMLPHINCTSTDVFEQGYLFPTPQLEEYGSGKRIYPAFAQILCTIAKFHH